MLFSLSFGIDRAPFDLLEQLSKRSEDVAAALDDPTLTAGSVVIATCNRFEVYAETGPQRGPAVLARVAAAAGVAEAELAEIAETATEGAAAEHLFSVASGLKSAVVGEGEIAGQVRRAHDEARDRGTLTHSLEHLFRTATRTSREVGHRTDIRSAGRSLVRLSLRIAEARITDWARADVLLIGTGAYAGATVAALRARGAERIHVYSPSGRAAAYAEQHDLMAVPEEGFIEALERADLVIACTRAEEPVLTPAMLVPGAAHVGVCQAGADVGDADLRGADLRGAERLGADPLGAAPLGADLLGADPLGTEVVDRPDHSRLLIDLGMPRNIDPSVAAIPGIELLDLETIAKHAPVAELSAEAEAHEIVRAQAAEFSASQAERDALPVLLALRTHVFGILEDELCRAKKAAGAATSAGGTEASAEASAAAAAESEARAAEVEAALRRFTGKLLHTPMTRIRSLGREGRVPDALDALETLFGIDPIHPEH